jgi:2-polyprenyl-3-methyl-5-hydroxy-6-metoxy-1,4-benzoquinol methylase
VIDHRERFYSNYYSTQVNVGATDAEKLARTNLPWARRLIRRTIPADRGIRLVDLGCGYGRLLLALKSMGYTNYVGVDGSESQLSVGRQLGLEGLILDDIQTFLRATPDKCFDVVTAIDLLEHLEKSELIKTLDQILRILRPNGRLVLHLPNAEGIFGNRIRYDDMTHEMAFTKTSLRQVLYACGFSSLHCYEDEPVPHGVVSFGRYVLWQLCRAFFVFLHSVETGQFSWYAILLTQNLTAVAIKSDTSVAPV